MQVLRECEHRFPVNEWTIDDVHIWPLIRIPFGLQVLSSQPSNSGSQSNLRRIAGKLDTGWQKLARPVIRSLAVHWRDRAGNARPDARVDAVFLTSSDARMRLIDGMQYDCFKDPFEPYLEKVGRASVSWERAGIGSAKMPRKYPSALIEWYLAYYEVKSRISPLRRLTLRLRNYEHFVEFIRSRGLCTRLIRGVHLVRTFSMLTFVARRFKAWLARCGTRVAFCYDYGIYEAALNLACRWLGIVSIEIQHGLQGSLHHVYADWTRLPKNGFELRPRFFWNWNSENADTINRWASAVSDYHFAFPGGNLWQRRWMEDSEFLKPYDSLVSNAVGSNTTNVLLALQPDLYDELIPREVLGVLRDSELQCRWWVRLHPRQESRLKELKQLLSREGIRNVEIDLANELPLNALLRHVRAQLTHSSTCIEDAARFGVPTVSWSDWAALYYPWLERDRVLVVANDTKGMVRAVSSLISREQLGTIDSPGFTPPEELLRELFTYAEAGGANPRLSLENGRHSR